MAPVKPMLASFVREAPQTFCLYPRRAICWRDRDASCGSEFCHRVKAMGIKEDVTAPDQHGRTPTSSP
jgi:hypothetical protein